MYRIVPTKHFERSLAKLRRSGYFKRSLEKKLEDTIDLLAEGTPLPVSYQDHQLTGDQQAYREKEHGSYVL
jgi:addiction module RelE/StbE family toxin